MSEETPIRYGVLYTDGSSVNARVVGGWGVHGYFFTPHAAKQGPGLKDWLITPSGYIRAPKGKDPVKRGEHRKLWHIDNAFAELAEDNKIKHVQVDAYVDALGGIKGPGTTHNVAELMALAEGLALARNNQLTQVRIFSDSEYAVRGFNESLETWAANHWQRSQGELANVDHWRRLYALKRDIEHDNIQLTVEWIKGHAGKSEGYDQDHIGNAMADHNAQAARIAIDNNFDIERYLISKPQGYWKPKIEANRLLAHANWYFDTLQKTTPRTTDGKSIYYIGNKGKNDNFIGKPEADTGYAVVCLKEPDPVMEALRARQLREDNNVNSIYISRLDYLFRPFTAQEMLTYQGMTLQNIGPNKDLYTVDKVRMTKELSPARLAFIMVESINVLEDVLAAATGEASGLQYTLTDITSLIYDSVETKKTTKKQIKKGLDSGFHELEVAVDHSLTDHPSPQRIKLSVGIDCPHRNALAAIASNDPKIEVVTWQESPDAFRYATIITTNDDVALFAGYYSNIYLFTDGSKR